MKAILNGIGLILTLGLTGSVRVSGFQDALVVSTFAGKSTQPDHVDGNGPTARFSALKGITTDKDGNVFVVDGETIRKITPDGTVSTFAGQFGVIGTNDGPAHLASFSLGLPSAPVANTQVPGLVFDRAGNLFMTDSLNRTIRKITPDGIVSTFAGTPRVSGTNDGFGNEALFTLPLGIAIDSQDNLLVAQSPDSSSSGIRIRRISSDGNVSTLPLQAQWRTSSTCPELTITSTGDLYCAHESISKISSDGVTTDLNGFSTFDPYFGVSAIAAAPDGSLVVGTIRHEIVRVLHSGEIVKIAGKNGIPGCADGVGTNATFEGIVGLCLDKSGNVYVSDSFNSSIRKISPDGQVSTLAGLHGGSEDGIGENARFYRPGGIALDAQGNLFVADTGNHTIRKISTNGEVTTFAGKAGETATRDGVLAEARFWSPKDLAFDASGNLFISDYETNINAAGKIRKIDLNGNVSTVLPKLGVLSSITFAGWITVDNSGNLYLDRSQNSPRIDKITPDGLRYSLGSTVRHLDGQYPDIGFVSPAGMAADPSNNEVYVADTSDRTIRKITPDMVVSTHAGQPGVVGEANGPALQAEFFAPTDVTVGSDGNIYVLDNGNTIRKISANAVVSTYLLSENVAQPYLRLNTALQLVPVPFGNKDGGIAASPSGKIFVVDSANNVIRVAVPDPLGLQVTFAENSFSVSWAASETNAVLESTAEVSATNSWSLVPGEPFKTGDKFELKTPVFGPTRFYRLRREPSL